MLGIGRRLIDPLRGLATDRRGVVLLEVALMTPVLVVLLMGAYDYGRYVLVHQKIQRTSTTVADLVARENSLVVGDMAGILAASEHVMAPFTLSSNGTILVSIITDPGSGDLVHRQFSGGGTLSKTSRLGAAGSTPTLPSGLTVDPGDVVVATEVFFDFDALFLPNWSIGDSLYQATYFRPRGSAANYLSALPASTTTDAL